MAEYGISVTVITPVWNSAETIAHCMKSVAEQSHSCQHILIDGKSTDDSLKIIEEHRTELTKVVSEPDQGMYDAINKGLARATGDVIGILNADDYYANDQVLAKIADRFFGEKTDAVYGDLQYVGRQDIDKVVRDWISGEYRRERFLNGWMPPHPTFYLRREFYEQLGGYRLDLGSAADYELMLRMLFKYNARATYIPEVLVQMRNDGMSNSSIKNRINANRNDRKAWLVNKLKPKPWTLVIKPVSKLGQWLN